MHEFMRQRAAAAEARVSELETALGFTCMAHEAAVRDKELTVSTAVRDAREASRRERDALLQELAAAKMEARRRAEAAVDASESMRRQWPRQLHMNL